MSKAFDSINQSISLQKLKALGLAPLAVPWFDSYLSKDFKGFALMLRCLKLYH